jgi:hypothetical protein
MDDLLSSARILASECNRIAAKHLGKRGQAGKEADFLAGLVGLVGQLCDRIEAQSAELAELRAQMLSDQAQYIAETERLRNELSFLRVQMLAD